MMSLDKWEVLTLAVTAASEAYLGMLLMIQGLGQLLLSSSA